MGLVFRWLYGLTKHMTTQTQNTGMVFQFGFQIPTAVWILNGQKEVGLQIVWILNWIWNLEGQPFEMWTNGCHFVKNHLKSRQKRTDFKWPGFRMVKTKAIAIAKAQPFENQPIWNQPLKSPGFKCFQISKGWISDPHYVTSCLIFYSFQQETFENQTFWRLVFEWSRDHSKSGHLSPVFEILLEWSRLYKILLIGTTFFSKRCGTLSLFVYFHRYVPGVGQVTAEDTIRREIIHLVNFGF